MVDVANEVVKLRQESERLAENQVTQGVVLVSDRREATAATYKAQADLLQASLGYLLAWAERRGHSSGSGLTGVLERGQVRRQLCLRIEYPPLHRPDRNVLGGGDLVVFPLLNEAQRHGFALA
jgi:hypothetical protein